MGQVNGTGGDFRPNSSETPGPIFMKLQIYNYFPDPTSRAKFQGAMSTWVVWLIQLKLAVGRFKCASAYIHAHNF